ncbi:MAG: hypothetical protein R3D59_06040 [Paracoccaceae bacterium]
MYKIIFGLMLIATCLSLLTAADAGAKPVTRAPGPVTTTDLGSGR